MATVAVLGAGYVGLTTAACLAHLGHEVRCTDVQAQRVERLSRGEVPIVEEGLPELVREGLASGRLQFSTDNPWAVGEASFTFLCVPTPQGNDGRADMSYIQAAAREIGPHLVSESVVVNKSTVPVGSTKVVEMALGRPDVAVVSNPEFLREGSAVHDFLHPDRIVIGADDESTAIKVSALFLRTSAPLVVTDPATAETIKYASNAFLATKVSFVNAIAALCEAVGADVRQVVLGMGSDRRIGGDFLRPGPGWGGSCFLGEETVLVARCSSGPRLVTLSEFVAEVEAGGVEGWEVLSWVPDAPAPHMAPVSAVTVRPYSGDVVHVMTEMGRRLTVTADHPLVVGDGVGSLPTGVIVASELNSDHWLPVSTGAPFHQVEPPVKFSLVTALAPDGSGDNEVMIEADPTFWRVVGLYLSVGPVPTDRDSPGSAPEGVLWHFDPTKEEDLVEFVAGYWRSMGARVLEYDAGTSRVVKVSSRLLAGLFLDVLCLGTNCYDHCLPDAIWACGEDAKRALLRGLWDGKGSWSLVDGGTNVVLEYRTVSRLLADGVLRLLGELDVLARLEIGSTAQSTEATYSVRISGGDQVDRCLWLFGEGGADAIRTVLLGANKCTVPTGCRPLLKNGAWVRVISAVPGRYHGQVYSLEVLGSHTVVTSGGLVAHNCFPKDTMALVRIAEDAGYDFSLLKGVIAVNEEQYERVASKAKRLAGGSLEGTIVALWGLTFKARTDDLRASPSLEVAARLRAHGATVRAYDPTVNGPVEGIEVRSDPYAACEGASVLVIGTEWDEFRWVDFNKVASVMTRRAVVDARNLLEPATLRRAGFTYEGVGLV